jgi:hypothetical protein
MKQWCHTDINTDDPACSSRVLPYLLNIQVGEVKDRLFTISDWPVIALNRCTWAVIHWGQRDDLQKVCYSSRNGIQDTKVPPYPKILGHGEKRTCEIFHCRSKVRTSQDLNSFSWHLTNKGLESDMRVIVSGSRVVQAFIDFLDPISVEATHSFLLHFFSFLVLEQYRIRTRIHSHLCSCKTI